MRLQPSRGSPASQERRISALRMNVILSLCVTLASGIDAVGLVSANGDVKGNRTSSSMPTTEMVERLEAIFCELIREAFGGNIEKGSDDDKPNQDTTQKTQ